jgi:hypothetical protein
MDSMASGGSTPTEDLAGGRVARETVESVLPSFHRGSTQPGKLAGCPEKNPARDFSPDAHGNAVMKVGSSDTPPPALRRARTAFGGDVRRELEAASMPNHSRDDGTCSEARNPPHV